MANTYKLETIAKTASGGSGLTSFDNTPSINDFGLVSFVGNSNGEEDLFTGDGFNSIVNISSSYSGTTFSSGVEINNDNQIVTIEKGGGFSVVRLWDADNPGFFRRTIALGKFPPQGVQFENIFPFPSINNTTPPESEDSEVVFIATPIGEFPKVALETYVSVQGENTFFEGTPSNVISVPMLADDGRVVSRDNSQIKVFNYGLNQSQVIASDTSLGRAPGISDNGKAVAFYGNDSGEGIFISIETDSGWERHRIAGVVGNGVLDPGETYEDTNNNGSFDPGEEENGLIGSFAPDERIGINYSETEDGGLGTVTYLAVDESGNESLISSQFNISSSSSEPNISHSLVAKVGEPANEVDAGLTGNIQDLNIYDPINDPGQIAFWTKTTTGEEAIVRANPIRKPIIIVPGILGSLPQNENVGEWLTNLGFNPELLKAEQITRIYDDLVETLERAGYTEGVNLFVATHDWRLSPGPIDGTIDGSINRSESELTDDTYEYSVDQLAFWMNKAEEEWKSQFPVGEPIPELDSVDVISHSAGGSVVRSYIQSTAYKQPDFSLPKIDNLITLGVPFRGVSNPWNPRQNDFDASPILQLARLIAKTAQTKVVNGQAITLSGNDYITPNEISQLSEKEFIDQYVPGLKALQATYPFIKEAGSSNTLRTAEYIDPNESNSLLIDLNSGFDSEIGEGDNDPNKFADGVERVTVVYGTGSEANDAVVEKIGPDIQLRVTEIGEVIEEPIPTVLPLEKIFPVPPKEGQLWYADLEGEVDTQGDGTVPALSAIGTFNDNNRSNIQLRNFPSVTHSQQPFDRDTQKFILETLGIDLKEELISTNLNNNLLDFYSIGNNGYNFAGAIINDPVEGFLIDGQGRRLGYSETTGAVTEIPNSYWFGAEDGIGFFTEPVEGPFQLELTGLGEDYFVSVALETEDGPAGIEVEGFLADGEQLTFDVPVNNFPILDLNGDADGIDSTANYPDTGGAILVTDSNLTITDSESQNLAGATIIIQNPEDGNFELLGATAVGNIAVNYDADTSTLTLAGTDTIANYQQVLSSVTYTNNAPNRNTTPREIKFVVDDGVSFNNLSPAATTILSVPENNGSQEMYTIVLGSGTTTIPDFGGVGAGTNPSSQILSEVDTLKFEGAGLTVNNLLLTQSSNDLILEFEGINDTKVILSDFALEDLDNLPNQIGNIIFDGQSVIEDNFDVFDLEETQGQVFGTNKVAFLDSFDNSVDGLDNSNDVINGQNGNDILDGKSGNDLIRGGIGNDNLSGGAGDDILNGNSGNDTLIGGTGNDTLNGQQDNDSLAGGDGGDILRGGDGNDTLIGGAGIDTITPGDGEDNIDGGDGEDTVVYANLLSTDVVLEKVGDVITVDNSDILANVENIQFSDTTIDTTTVGSQPVLMGDDITVIEGDSLGTIAQFTFNLSEPASADVQFDYNTVDDTALAGEDYIATSGQVTIAAGESNATVEVELVGDTEFEPDEMFALNLSGLTGATFANDETEYAVVAKIENDDSQNTPATTTGIKDIIVTQNAPDSIVDLFGAFENADSLTYSIEGNTNNGLFDRVAVDGTTGTLTLDYAERALGSAELTVRATNSQGEFIETDFTVSAIASSKNKDTLIGGEGNDYLDGGKDKDYLDGGLGNDTLIGDDKEDTLYGDEGNDYLDGGKDKDYLDGGLGNDTLIGGDKKDTLIGGEGNDVLSGGKDKDTFVLMSGQGTDTIEDFENKKDSLALADGLTFGQLTIGQGNSNTIISVTDSGETLAILMGIESNSIDAKDFTDKF